MGDDRPSDALQPSSKRRAAGQRTKDDADDDDDEQVQDPGSWKPVDGDEISKRRKVKVRRAGGAEPADGAKQTSNPFAGIALAAPAAGANPFAGINLTPPAAAQAKKEEEQAKEPATTEAAVTAGAEADKPVAEGETATAPAVTEETPQPAAKDAASTPVQGFGSFAVGSNPFAALTSSSKSGGFGGFGGFNSAQLSKPIDTPSTTPTAFTPLFGTSAKPSGFSFGTSAFPAIGATPKADKPGDGDGDEGAGDDGNVELFNDSTAEFKPVVQLPDQKTVTGEEEESVAFTADSTLYEFEPSASKWRERGKGEFRLNLDKSGQARMVMRQAGNYRLLLNAKVYSGMAVQKMTGDVGVTFACANAASTTEPATPAEKKDGEAAGSTTPGTDGAPKLATWCLKIKSRELVTRLYDLLGQHKCPTPSATM